MSVVQCGICMLWQSSGMVVTASGLTAIIECGILIVWLSWGLTLTRHGSYEACQLCVVVVRRHGSNTS
jgi:hypothetical protein